MMNNSDLENHVRELIRKNPNLKDEIIDLWDLFVTETEDEEASRSNEFDHFYNDLSDLKSIYIPATFPRSI